MKKLLLLITLLFLVIGIAYLSTHKFSQLNERSSQVTSPQSIPKMDDVTIIGWTAYWDEQNTLNTLQENMDKLDVFSPILYQIAEDGTLEPLTVNNKNDVVNLARENNVPIVPVIGDDFDYDRVKKLLTNKKTQETFIDELIDEAKKEGYSGWSIDIETVKSSDKEVFSEFVKNTAAKLNENKLELTMILYARDADEKFDAALSQDYAVIGQHANHIILMTYGYHNGSTSAGGQAPLDWYKSVLTYTTEHVPLEKIGLGLTTHGYEWSKEEVTSYTYPEIADLIEQYNAVIKYDSQSSQIAEYKDNDEDHTIWYEDAKTMKEKMNIAMQEFGITNFAIWRVGAEDPKLWELLK